MSTRTLVVSLAVVSVVAAACGPSRRDGDDAGCVGADCDAACEPGAVEDCYSGPGATLGVGPCVGGRRTCSDGGTWGSCIGEVTPRPDVCGNAIDENCSGTADEMADADHDGFATCDGDCCDDGVGCTDPELVNPGAFESPGNNVDDDCDGGIDNVVAACDAAIASNTADPLDYARAMDLCQTTDEASLRWGVIDARLSLASGAGVPDPRGRAVRDGFGTAIPPQRGGAMVVLSSGVAADRNDTQPGFVPGGAVPHGGQVSAFPADWLAANGGALPNAPGCPPPASFGCGNGGCDPVMLTLRVRVPTNARSFSLKIYFLSHEFPEWVCTEFNDMFVVLLDSAHTGDPANPTDKNLAFYSDPVTLARTPVGVNLAHDNTGLYTQCVNGGGGCFGDHPFQVTSCLDASELAGTGFDGPEAVCGTANQLEGGGTGWLTTSGNVVGGEVMKLRIAIWDTSDQIYDSTAIIDDFEWSVDAASPGTVIE